MRIILFLFVVPMLAMLLNGCSRSTGKARSSPTSGITSIWVDETFAPIVQNQIDVFEGIYKTASVIPYYTSEVDALNALLNDSTQLILSTRKLTDQERAYFLSKQYVPNETTIAVDAIAIIVHPDNPLSRITTGQLRDIVTGKIVSWNELDPNGISDSIRVIFDNPESSTVRYIVEEIAETANLAPGLSALGGNEQVIEYVQKYDDALGLIGASWISNTRDSTLLSFKENIKVLEVSSASEALSRNSFLPLQAFMATREYPLCREVYLILTEPWHGLASGFVSFVASERGQRIILKSGIFPANHPVRLIQVRETW